MESTRCDSASGRTTLRKSTFAAPGNRFANKPRRSLPKGSFSYNRTAALDEHRVAPVPIHFSNSLTHADAAETMRLAQPQAGGVFRENAALQSPNAGSFCGLNKVLEQQTASSLSTSRCGNVNADFGNAGVHSAARNRAERRPAENLVVAHGHQSSC